MTSRNVIKEVIQLKLCLCDMIIIAPAEILMQVGTVKYYFGKINTLEIVRLGHKSALLLVSKVHYTIQIICNAHNVCQ